MAARFVVLVSIVLPSTDYRTWFVVMASALSHDGVPFFRDLERSSATETGEESGGDQSYVVSLDIRISHQIGSFACRVHSDSQSPVCELQKTQHIRAAHTSTSGCRSIDPQSFYVAASKDTFFGNSFGRFCCICIAGLPSGSEMHERCE